MPLLTWLLRSPAGLRRGGASADSAMPSTNGTDANGNPSASVGASRGPGSRGAGLASEDSAILSSLIQVPLTLCNTWRVPTGSTCNTFFGNAEVSNRACGGSPGAGA
jgi:hypothetical protein